MKNIGWIVSSFLATALLIAMIENAQLRAESGAWKDLYFFMLKTNETNAKAADKCFATVEKYYSSVK